VSDAHAHCKYVAYHPDAVALLEAAGVGVDDGYVELLGRAPVTEFIQRCRALRHWAREADVDQT
jgi:catalase